MVETITFANALPDKDATTAAGTALMMILHKGTVEKDSLTQREVFQMSDDDTKDQIQEGERRLGLREGGLGQKGRYGELTEVQDAGLNHAWIILFTMR